MKRPFIIIALELILFMSFCQAIANSTTPIDILKKSVPEVLNWQNVTKGSAYEGYFSQDSVFPTGASRRQEVIYPLVWLYFNDPTGQYLGNETILNASLSGIDYLIRVSKTDGGWASSDTNITLKTISSASNLATAFTSGFMADSFELLNNSNITWGYSERFIDIGKDDDYSSPVASIIGSVQNNNRWGPPGLDGDVDYRCTNSTSAVYFDIKVSSGQVDNYANGSLHIRYFDNLTGTVAVAFTNTTGPGIYESLEAITLVNDSSWKTAIYNIPPRIRATAFDRYTIRLTKSGLCVDWISSGLDRQYEFSQVLIRNAGFLDNYRKTCSVGTYPYKCEIGVNTNTNAGTMYALEKYSRLFGNISWSITASNMLEEIYNLTVLYNNSFTEINEVLRTMNYNNPDYYQKGYSSNYLIVAGEWLSLYYNLTGNDTAKTILEKNWNFTADTIFYQGNLSWAMSGAPSTRKDETTVFTQQKLNIALLVYGMIMSDFNPYARQIANLSSQYLLPINISIYYGNTDTAFNLPHLILLNKHWKDIDSSSVDFPTENTLSHSLKDYSGLGMHIIITPNYNVYISYKAAFPSGGVIADVFDKNRKTHLFSGQGADTTDFNYIPYGLGSLKYGTCSNAWTINSTVTVLRSVYPIRLNYVGDMFYVNQTPCGIRYNTTYSFYDDYIEISQEVNSSVTMQIWPLSIEMIGNGSINQNNFKILENISFVTDSTDLIFNDSSSTATWGNVDNINSTGTVFRYFIGFSPYNSSSDFLDSNLTGINLPTLSYSLQYLNRLYESNTLSNQSFMERYNLSVGLDLIDLNFRKNGTIIVINLTQGDNIIERNISGDFITEDSWTITGSSFASDTAYNIYRTFTINNTLDRPLPQFEIYVPLANYSATELAEQQDGILWPDLSSRMSGSTLIFNISAQNQSTSQQYRYSYDAKLIEFVPFQLPTYIAAKLAINEITLTTFSPSGGAAGSSYLEEGSTKHWAYRGNFALNFDLAGKNVTRNIPTAALGEWDSKIDGTYTVMFYNSSSNAYPYDIRNDSDTIYFSFDPPAGEYAFSIDYYTPISSSSPEVVYVQGGGGGGSSSTIEVPVSMNGTIDWDGLDYYSITLFNTPNTIYKEVLITALDGDINGELNVSPNLAKYAIDYGVCDVSGEECSTSVHMVANEKKRFFIRWEFPDEFADQLQSVEGGIVGDISISSPYRSETWPVIIQKGGFFDQSRILSMDLGIPMQYTAFLLFGGMILVLLAGGGYLILKAGGSA